MDELMNTNERPEEAVAETGEDGEAVARPIEVITAEIWAYKQQAGYAILEIGRRLNEAKEQLTHGEWLPWLKEKVEFSEATAQRFMRLAREYTNPSTVTDLGASKALSLLALPASEREEFLAEKHNVNGEEKTAFEMSNAELAAAIKERDEAKRREEEAVDRLAEARTQAETYEEMVKQTKYQAEQDAERARKDLEALREELKALKAGPVEVVVEKTADPAEIKVAVEKAEAQLKTKIEKAEKAKAKAEQEKAKAEGDLAAMKVAQEQANKIAEREKEALAEQVQALQKKLAMASSSEITVFKLYFDQTQENINKMAECVGRMREAGDQEGADRLKTAFAALLDAAREEIH